jgi:hypothetical protein
MHPKEMTALYLISSLTGGGLTHRANVIVSQNAAALINAGLVRYGSGRVAYTLTAAGKKIIDEDTQRLAGLPIRADADRTDLAQLELYGSTQNAAAAGMYGLVMRLTSDVPL